MIGCFVIRLVRALFLYADEAYLLFVPGFKAEPTEDEESIDLDMSVLTVQDSAVAGAEDVRANETAKQTEPVPAVRKTKTKGKTKSNNSRLEMTQFRTEKKPKRTSTTAQNTTVMTEDSSLSSEHSEFPSHPAVLSPPRDCSAQTTGQQTGGSSVGPSGGNSQPQVSASGSSDQPLIYVSILSCQGPFAPTIDSKPPPHTHTHGALQCSKE